MRKTSLIKLGFVAAAGFIVAPLVEANAADDNARVYYKDHDGTRIETSNFDLKINLQIQSKVTFEDNDQGGRRDLGLESGEDVLSMDLRRVRAIFTGNAVGKLVSFKLQNDFRSDSGGGQLKDAWLQLNSDDANLRLGQTKVVFSRQELVNSSELQFVDRSIVSDIFSPSRHIGALLHGDAGDVHYYLGTFNGESVGEGINRPGVDTKLAVYAALNTNIGDYGSRAYEGDMRENGEMAFTVGAAAIYGQATGDPLDGGADSDYDRFDLNVDLGMRSAGTSVQTEFYYSSIDPDAGDDSADLFGFYVQAGHMIGKDLEPALRFAYYGPDSDFSSIDDVEEYAAVLNYFLNGHWLKVQTGVVWERTTLQDSDDDISDFRFESQLAGYF